MQKSKLEIINLNVHEESHIQEILQELIQEFNENPETLKQFLVNAIDKLVNGGEVQFYEYDYSRSKEISIGANEALTKIHGNEIWDKEHQPKLHIYKKNN